MHIALKIFTHLNLSFSILPNIVEQYDLMFAMD